MSNETIEQRLPLRYKVVKDRKDEYCLKACADGDLVDWGEYEGVLRVLTALLQKIEWWKEAGALTTVEVELSDDIRAARSYVR